MVAYTILLANAFFTYRRTISTIPYFRQCDTRTLSAIIVNHTSTAVFTIIQNIICYFVKYRSIPCFFDRCKMNISNTSIKSKLLLLLKVSFFSFSNDLGYFVTHPQSVKILVISDYVIFVRILYCLQSWQSPFT